jgi:hypothetical protein
MDELSSKQKREARKLARAGYGRENICVKLGVPTNNPWIAEMVRRTGHQKSVRTRLASSVHNRKASVSLPTLSILCGND